MKSRRRSTRMQPSVTARSKRRVGARAAAVGSVLLLSNSGAIAKGCGYTAGEASLPSIDGNECNPGRANPGVSPSHAGVAARHGALIISEYLLHRVATGDSQAVKECIARFGGLVWSLARRLGLPDAEAEDAVHEIFTEIWKNGHKYDAGIASETAFVATIARRRLIDRKRRIGRQPVKSQLHEGIAQRGSDAGEGQIRVGLSDDARAAAQAMQLLSADQQKVLRLSVYEGLSHELISRSTGLPLGTVKTHARRGLIKLRELLSASGFNRGGDGESGVAGQGRDSDGRGGLIGGGS